MSLRGHPFMIRRSSLAKVFGVEVPWQLAYILRYAGHFYQLYPPAPILFTVGSIILKSYSSFWSKVATVRQFNQQLQLIFANNFFRHRGHYFLMLHDAHSINFWTLFLWHGMCYFCDVICWTEGYFSAAHACMNCPRRWHTWGFLLAANSWREIAACLGTPIQWE